MKRKTIRNLLILPAPFLIIIIVNESVRSSRKEPGYSLLGITAMNPATRTTAECNWACHNDSKFCQDYHTTFMRPYFKKTDPVYMAPLDC